MIALTGVLKDIRRSNHLRTWRRKRAWLWVHRRPVFLSLLTLAGAVVSGLGIVKTTREKANLRSDNLAIQDSITALQGKVQEQSSAMDIVLGQTLASISAPPRVFLTVVADAPVSYDGYASDEIIARDSTTEVARGKAVGFIYRAVRDVLFPPSYYADTFPQGLGYIILKNHAWTSQWYVLPSGYIRPVPSLDQGTKHIAVVRAGYSGDGHTGTPQFALRAQFQTEMRAVDVLDGIRRTVSEKQPILSLGMVGHQRGDITQYWRQKLRKVDVNFCLDPDGRYVVHLPLTLSSSNAGLIQMYAADSVRVNRREIVASGDPCGFS